MSGIKGKTLLKQLSEETNKQRQMSKFKLVESMAIEKLDSSSNSSKHEPEPKSKEPAGLDLRNAQITVRIMPLALA
jgi:hypothetical protein